MNWTDKDIEIAYLIGVVNTSAIMTEDSIDIILHELNRLKKLDMSIPKMIKGIKQRSENQKNILDSDTIIK